MHHKAVRIIERGISEVAPKDFSIRILEKRTKHSTDHSNAFMDLVLEAPKVGANRFEARADNIVDEGGIGRVLLSGEFLRTLLEGG